MLIYFEGDQVSLFDPDLCAGKMCQVHSPAANRRARISTSSLNRSSELSSIPYQFLDLTPGAGNLLGVFYWETLSPWRGELSIRNTGPAPRNGGAGSSLWQILEEQPHPRYYLTKKACLGILRRSSERKKELPFQLKQALEVQAGIRLLPTPPETDPKHLGFDGYNGDLTGAVSSTLGVNCGMSSGRSGVIQPMAFAQNQRDEVRDLHGIAGALAAQQGIKQQTFVADTPRDSPILCLNDQGGQFMSLSENITGTLRAQMNQHQPLVLDTHQNSEHPSPVVYENHGIDSRYTGPLDVAPTMSARYGTGGNNVPLVGQSPESFCIVGNIIDRQPENGGNGLGGQKDIAYTLTAMDHHAVFNRQRVDTFQGSNVGSTESARQGKDSTDLIVHPYQQTVGTLGFTDHKGISNQYVGEDKCVVENTNLIRRLTPLECERLQGFPDGWTDILGASDSARYKALGNSVAIPCVDFVMNGMATVIRNAIQIA